MRFTTSQINTSDFDFQLATVVIAPYWSGIYGSHSKSPKFECSIVKLHMKIAIKLNYTSKGTISITKPACTHTKQPIPCTSHLKNVCFINSLYPELQFSLETTTHLDTHSNNMTWFITSNWFQLRRDSWILRKASPVHLQQMKKQKKHFLTMNFIDPSTFPTISGYLHISHSQAEPRRHTDWTFPM